MEASITPPLVSFWLYIICYCSSRITHRKVSTFPKNAVAVVLTDVFPTHWWPDLSKSKSSRTKSLTKYLLHVLLLLSGVVRRNELMQWAERHPNYTVVPVCVKVSYTKNLKTLRSRFMKIVYSEVYILKRIASQGFFNLPNTPITMCFCFEPLHWFVLYVVL
jgi:hypothetical protein